MKYFERIIEITISILFGLFCILMMLQVFSRNFLSISFLWFEELSKFSFIWMILLASGITIKRGAHMGFDLVVRNLGHKTKMLFEAINHVLVGVFLVLLFIKGIDLVLIAGKTPSPSMKIPMGIIYLIMPLSAIIMFVFLL